MIAFKQIASRLTGSNGITEMSEKIHEKTPGYNALFRRERVVFGEKIVYNPRTREVPKTFTKSTFPLPIVEETLITPHNHNSKVTTATCCLA